MKNVFVFEILLKVFPFVFKYFGRKSTCIFEDKCICICIEIHFHVFDPMSGKEKQLREVVISPSE